MANTFFKMLNESVQNKYTESIIAGVQKDLKENSGTIGLNLYDVIQEIEKDSSQKGFDINVLLKCYVLNQIIKETNVAVEKKQEEKNLFTDTANPTIKVNVQDKKFYKLKDNHLVISEEIESVNEDGSYVVIEKKNTFSYVIKKTYSKEDVVLSIQLVCPGGRIESNKFYAAEILGMKKEFAQKFKYSGISGESNDIIAILLNKLNSPVETGYYMDKSYNLYKWSDMRKCFIRNLKEEAKSPLLTDYEFVNKIVIRKDYTGINK